MENILRFLFSLINSISQTWFEEIIIPRKNRQAKLNSLDEKYIEILEDTDTLVQEPENPREEVPLTEEEQAELRFKDKFQNLNFNKIRELMYDKKPEPVSLTKEEITEHQLLFNKFYPSANKDNNN